MQSVAHLTEEPEVLGSIPSLALTFVETDHGIFSMVIFPLPLIQEGLLSVGERIGSHLRGSKPAQE